MQKHRIETLKAPVVKRQQYRQIDNPTKRTKPLSDNDSNSGKATIRLNAESLCRKVPTKRQNNNPTKRRKTPSENDSKFNKTTKQQSDEANKVPVGKRQQVRQNDKTAIQRIGQSPRRRTTAGPAKRQNSNPTNRSESPSENDSSSDKPTERQSDKSVRNPVGKRW